MEIWLDTVDEETIRLGNHLGFIHGITTNPSILRRSSLPKEQMIKKLLMWHQGPVAVQVEATTCAAIYSEAKELLAASKKLIPKIAVHVEGLAAIRRLSQEGIDVIATTILSENQAFLAALAGAAYVAPYLGRMDEKEEFLIRVPKLLRAQKMKTKILAASISDARWVTECALHQIEAVTLKENVFREWVKNEEKCLEILTAWGSSFSLN